MTKKNLSGNINKTSDYRQQNVRLSSTKRPTIVNKTSDNAAANAYAARLRGGLKALKALKTIKNLFFFFLRFKGRAKKSNCCGTQYAIHNPLFAPLRKIAQKRRLSRSSYASSKKYQKPLKTLKKGLLEGVWVASELCFFKKSRAVARQTPTPRKR